MHGMTKKRWTDEQLIEAVRTNDTMKGVGKALGLTAAGKCIQRRIQELHLDISHILNNPHKHTEETKRIMSQKRKAFLAEHIDQRNNRPNYHLKESPPEAQFRRYLMELGISACQYYMPPQSERRFEFDFAIPEVMIAFEINGSQHYNRDGYLAPYYQERHNYLTALGWTVNEIHYLECFKEVKVKAIITECVSDKVMYNSDPQIVNARRKAKDLISKEDLEQRLLITSIQDIAKELDLGAYSVRELMKMYGIERPNRALHHTAKEKQAHQSARKTLRPSKEELEKAVWEQPSTQIAKRYGVSDRIIGKWAEAYNLSKPPRGYWQKLQAEQALYKGIGRKACEYCMAEFVLTDRAPTQTYCSTKCLKKAQRKRAKERGYVRPTITKQCIANGCINTFVIPKNSNKKYCSPECRRNH